MYRFLLFPLRPSKNIEKNTEKNMEKFTEKIAEKYFCIFFCKFFCIFFRIFFQNPKTRLLQPTTAVCFNIWAICCSYIKKNRLIELFIWIWKKIQKKIRKNLQKKIQKNFSVFFSVNFSVFFSVFFSIFLDGRNYYLLGEKSHLLTKIRRSNSNS